MPLHVYESVRAQDEADFAGPPGHETPELETAVEWSDEYVIVDKVPAAEPLVEDDPARRDVTDRDPKMDASATSQSSMPSGYGRGSMRASSPAAAVARGVELDPDVVAEHARARAARPLPAGLDALSPLGGETRDVAPGDTWSIPSNAPHEATAGPDGRS